WLPPEGRQARWRAGLSRRAPRRRHRGRRRGLRAMPRPAGGAPRVAEGRGVEPRDPLGRRPHHRRARRARRRDRRGRRDGGYGRAGGPADRGPHLGLAVAVISRLRAVPRYRGSANKTLRDHVAAVETPDPLRVRFRLKQPWPDFMTFYTSATAAGWV